MRWDDDSGRFVEVDARIIELLGAVGRENIMKSAVRCMPFEVFGFANPDSRKTWRDLSNDCREIVNTIWQQWESWHVANGTGDELRFIAAELRAYYKSVEDAKPTDGVEVDTRTIGCCWEKPKFDNVIKPMPPQLAKQIRDILASRYPGVHGTVRELLFNLTSGRMTGKASDGGPWRIWQAILLNRQGRPSVSSNQPIPFGVKNCKPIKQKEGQYTNYTLEVSLVRDPVTGKGMSDQVKLVVKKKGVAIMEKIAGGMILRGNLDRDLAAIRRKKAAKMLTDEQAKEAVTQAHHDYNEGLSSNGFLAFCGSSLVYSKSKGKWFAMVSYMRPSVDHENLDPNKVAVVRPGRKRPWCVRFDGFTKWMGGRGSSVAAQRRNLLTSRWSRQENYTLSGSSNKGHGRKRAMAGVSRLSEGWKDFTKSYNQGVANEIVKWCVQKGIGTIVYLQPSGDNRDSRFLATAGKVEGRKDATSWDWAQFGTILTSKCEDNGIACRTERTGVSKSEDGINGKNNGKQKRVAKKKRKKKVA